MALNFKINIHRTIDNLYLRSMGDFDGMRLGSNILNRCIRCSKYPWYVEVLDNLPAKD